MTAPVIKREARMEGNDRMKAEHHNLDIKPIPEKVLYINEPDITGVFCGNGLEYIPNWERLFEKSHDGDTASWYAEQAPDHVRVYVPLDLSKECILAYFEAVLARFQRADERNESDFSSSIEQVITRLEIYDQVWFVREMSKPWKDDDVRLTDYGQMLRHSRHATEIARVIVDELLLVANDGCTAEHFPYETIDMLCREYGFEMVEW
jgi:hypothetical protein